MTSKQDWRVFVHGASSVARSGPHKGQAQSFVPFSAKYIVRPMRAMTNPLLPVKTDGPACIAFKRWEAKVVATPDEALRAHDFMNKCINRMQDGKKVRAPKPHRSYEIIGAQGFLLELATYWEWGFGIELRAPKCE
jgi:hypothetical protein